MGHDSVEEAIRRIEAALARVEAAAAQHARAVFPAPGEQASVEMRGRVEEALAQLDALIARAEGR